jgi:hypothetical protein
MKRVIKRSYKLYGQEKGNSFVNIICQRMKDDTQFGGLMAAVTELKSRNTTYELAAAEAADGGKTLTRVKNDAYDALINQADEVADQVDALAKGNDLVALAAGFDLLSDSSSTVVELTTPTGLTVTNITERTGCVKAKWDANRATLVFAFEYQVKGETTWTNGTYGTGTSTEMAGLPAGVYVYVRAYAIGRKGVKTDYTEPVLVLVS